MKESKRFTKLSDVEKYIDDFLSKLPYAPATAYIIMRYGYTEKELLNDGYSIELLEYSGDYDIYVWNDDWFEGQSFIEIYAILTDDDILSVFGYQNKDGE